METAGSIPAHSSGALRKIAITDRFAAQNVAAAVIVAVFVGMAVWYSMAVPAFETPDELYHYAFSRHVAQGNGLPVQSDQATGPWQQEGSQAPLYYLLTGWLTSGIEQDDFEALSVLNPRSNMGNPLYQGNKNRMLYSAAERPLRQTNLALHMGRWFSVVLGAVALWLVYLTAQMSFAPGTWLPVTAMLVVASIPQYIFISASFSNDNMIVLAASATVYWLARFVVRDSDDRILGWEWLILGLLLGIAALSKLQGLGLWLLAGGVALWLAVIRRDPILPLRALLPVAIPALLVAGWWYWRNIVLYGDWSGLGHLVSINGMRTKPLELEDFWHEFRGLRYSFWGLFGWFNILLPNWVYLTLDLVAGLSLLGLIAKAFGVRIRSGLRDNLAEEVELPAGHTRVRWLLVAWAVLSAVLLWYWMSRATGSQGRLIFPAIGALVILLITGLSFWSELLPRRARWVIFVPVPALLMACSLYVGAVLFPRSYGPLPPVAAVPSYAAPVEITYGEAPRTADSEQNSAALQAEGDQIVLLAVEAPTPESNRRYAPGDEVPVTLYLTAPRRMAHDYELFIQLLDENGEPVGNVTSHPGWGRFPTTLWQPGMIYADTYTVRVAGAIDTRSPLLARVYTGFIQPNVARDENSDELLPVTAWETGGAEVTPVVAEVVLQSRQQPTAGAYEMEDAGPQFGTSVRLSALRSPRVDKAERAVNVGLLWEATEAPPTDLTTFVHVLDEDGAYVAGFDQSPAGDRFPTRYWRPGDRIVSDFTVELPPDIGEGVYTVWLGLYETASRGAARVPITDPAGFSTAHEMLLIDEVEIASASR